MRLALILAVAATLPVAAQAGGRVDITSGTLSCAELARVGSEIPLGTRCIDANGQSVEASETVLADAAGGASSRLFCPYPHRPSDSVFMGASGYLTKDQRRQQLGCGRR